MARNELVLIGHYSFVKRDDLFDLSPKKKIQTKNSFTLEKFYFSGKLVEHEFIKIEGILISCAKNYYKIRHIMQYTHVGGLRVVLSFLGVPVYFALPGFRFLYMYRKKKNSILKALLSR